MNQIIVVGNIYDSNNVFCAAGRVYDGGGIAPTLGASRFAREKYILVEVKHGNDKNKASNQTGLD